MAFSGAAHRNNTIQTHQINITPLCGSLYVILPATNIWVHCT